jgi:hypothetical protein
VADDWGRVDRTHFAARSRVMPTQMKGRERSQERAPVSLLCNSFTPERDDDT